MDYSIPARTYPRSDNVKLRIASVFIAVVFILSLFCGCKRQATLSYNEAISLTENYLTNNGYIVKKNIGDYQYGELTKIIAEKDEKTYNVTFFLDENKEMPVGYEVETVNYYTDESPIYSKIDYSFFNGLANVLKDTDTNANEIKKAVEDKRDYYDNGNPEGPDTEGYKMVKIYGQNIGEMRVLYYLQGGDSSNIERVVVQGVCG
mgnify:CR=1 FL=1